MRTESDSTPPLAQVLLQEADELFFRVLDASSDAVALTRADDLRFVYANEAFCNLTGYPQAEVIDRTGAELELWTMPAGGPSLMDQLQSNGFVPSMRTRLRVRSGETRPVSLSAQSLEVRGERCVLTVARDLTEQHQLQDDVRRLAAIVESTDDAIISESRDGIILTWNAGAERMYGYPAAEVVGLPISILVPPDRPEELRALLDRVWRGDHLEPLETVRLTKEGRRIDVSVRLSATRDAGGVITGASSIARDITERKQQELRAFTHHEVTRILSEVQTLRRAAPAILETVCTSLRWDFGALWLVDREHGVLRCRRAWYPPGAHLEEFETACLQMRAHPGESLPGRVWSTVEPAWITDVTRDAAFSRVSAAQATGLRADLAFPIRTDGTVLGVMEFLSREARPCEPELLRMMAAVGGQVGQFIARRMAERSVRESEARKGAILEASLDCVITIDHEGRILDFNPSAERTFGHDRKAVIGRDMADLIIPPALRAQHRQALARRVEMGDAPALRRRIELTGMRADGTEFPVELTVTRVDLPGRPIFTGHIRDISARKEAERRLMHVASIVETSDDAIFSMSLEGTILSWNAGAERMYQHRVDEAIGRSISLVIPADRAGEGFEILERMARGEPLERLETVRVRKDGSRLPVSLTISPIRDHTGRIVAASTIARDMTDRKQTESKLREAEARYRSLVEQIPAVTYIDAMDELSSTLYISPQVERLSGYPPQEWMGVDELWVKILHPEDRDRVMAEHERTNRTGDPFAIEYRLIHRDGSVVWVRDEALVVRDEEGAPSFWQGIMLDITERKRAEEQIAFLAYHDKLTHLPNKALFEELLDLALARSRRRDQALAVLYMDLDNFKLVNDSLGHGCGDELLMQMSQRLREVARETDVVARQGGDEFMLLLADLDRHPPEGSADPVQLAESLANRIHEAMNVPFILAGTELYVSGSIGISVFPDDATDRQSLLRNADQAMYRSKRWRQGGHVVYSSDATDPLSELSFSTQLRRAVELEHWVLHYQPLVSLRDGMTWGAEALIRWRDPGGELILPGMFIPLAEEMGLSEAIGDWVLQEVCLQAAEWRGRGFDITTTYNLSTRQLLRKNLVQRVVSSVSAAGIDPSRIVIEITESTAMHDPDHTQQILWDLHDNGIRLAIDDFGSGYSSFSRLKHLPVDILKIDRSFVRDLPQDHDARTICTAIVKLAANLGLVSLAEGIETDAQRRFLIELGCGLGQGFLFSRAVPAEEITSLLGSPVAASG